MRIHVKTLDGGHTVVELEPHRVVARIAAAPDVRVVFAGKLCDHLSTLDACGIEDGATVFLLPPVRPRLWAATKQ